MKQQPNNNELNLKTNLRILINEFNKMFKNQKGQKRKLDEIDEDLTADSTTE
jgi:hypothetical protein